MSRHAAGPSGLRVDPQARPRRSRELPFALVVVVALAGLSVAAAGFGLTAVDRFRVTTALLAAAFVLATLLRLLLHERDAGLLVVRSRTLDVLCLGTLGLGLTVLTVVVPPSFCPSPSAPAATGAQASCPASGAP